MAGPTWRNEVDAAVGLELGSLGHPIAASGARMVTTLIYELQRRGGGIGVAAMCAGGGQGGAVIVEV
jgi:acetyl-CoA C-acetyltransferase